jgi:hypothetical protein
MPIISRQTEKTRHGKSLHFRAKTVLIMILLLILSQTQIFFGFGPEGHEGAYTLARRLLQADDENLCAIPWPVYSTSKTTYNWEDWRSQSSLYPDEAAVYVDVKSINESIRQAVTDFALATKLINDIDIPQNIQDALVKKIGESIDIINNLNSGSHYYNPKDPLKVAGPFAIQDGLAFKLVELLMQYIPVLENMRPDLQNAANVAFRNKLTTDILLNRIKGKSRDFPQYLDQQYGESDCPINAYGYNALTSILLFLYDDTSNGPLPDLPEKSIINLAKDRQFDNTSNEYFRDALVKLGTTIHFLSDLFSPGHTDWLSWPDDLHDKFDKLGDQFFETALHRTDISPYPLLRFNKVTGSESDSEYLKSELHKAAVESQLIWEKAKEKPESERSSYSAPESHFLKCAAMIAGLIDLVFSSAAEHTDGAYTRDATGFFGMAKGLSKDSGAVLTPVRIPGGYTLSLGESVDGPLDCFLGGIDRDDYFPISGNRSGMIRVTVWDGYENNGMSNIKAQLYDLKNNTVNPINATINGRYLEVDLKKLGMLSDFILRVSSENGDKFRYTVSLTEPEERGLLDVVFCIDVSGSMMDDINEVKKVSGETLAELQNYAAASNISLHVGLVTYTRHTETGWLHDDIRLTPDIASLRDHINDIEITDADLGAGGNEDTYGAVMYAMNQTVGGNKTDMGWRTKTGTNGAAISSKNPTATGTAIDIGNSAEAAKIIITMGDELQDDPDWEDRDLAQVADTAQNFDPVHIYPILLPKEGSGFLNNAVAMKKRLADATGGSLIKVDDPKKLPATLVETVKLAVRQHREEVWRKSHPPYALYALGALIGILALFGIAALQIQRRRRLAEAGNAADAAKQQIDPLLTGESQTDEKDSPRIT